MRVCHESTLYLIVLLFLIDAISAILDDSDLIDRLFVTLGRTVWELLILGLFWLGLVGV